MTSPVEQAVDLYVSLRRQARLLEAEFIIAHTPPDLIFVMRRLVGVAPAGEGEDGPGMD